MIEHTDSLSKTASWVVIRRADHYPMFETFNAKILDHLNYDKYDAIPILKWLGMVNRGEV